VRALPLDRRAAAEGVGTALLLAGIVGSGIMAERLAGGNVALALLANAIATGALLVALIAALAPISGAHLNPIVTLGLAFDRALGGRDAAWYVAAQVAGAFAGVASAHAMFAEPLFSTSQHARSGSAQLWSESVATFGLVTVIWSTARFHARAVPIAVGAYITAAYWFTASTSFANPAVAVARAATDTFTGIRPADVPGFVAAQLAGGLAAWGFQRWLAAEPRA
jgi:glycerol uptake facilitator-like aquaporin